MSQSSITIVAAVVITCCLLAFLDLSLRLSQFMVCPRLSIQDLQVVREMTSCTDADAKTIAQRTEKMDQALNLRCAAAGV